jgi:SAM-dependent methyltransferase
VKQLLRRLRGGGAGPLAAVEYEGIPIPPPGERQGGDNFRQDERFVQAGVADARRLEEAFGLAATTPVLDVGCGNGRLAIGLLRHVGEMQSYTGIDVSARSIAWCEKHLASRYPGLRFVHLDVENERYNPGGSDLSGTFRLPLPDASVDVIYLYSVFSHMETDHIRRYLREFARVLRDGGGIFLTAFLEDDVPKMEVNPPGYLGVDWEGALHCVRYERGFFEELVDEAGLRIDRLDHRSDTNDQSAVFVRRATARG